MKIKRCKKKGMTLIEAIISVALLSVLIIPISGMIMTATQTNKKAEVKQEASFIGQKLLEEIKSYDNINLKGNNKFQLLDGEVIEKESDTTKGYDYYGKFNRDGFDVEVKMIKSSDFNYELSETIDYTFKINENEIVNRNNDKYDLDVNEELNLVINGDNITFYNDSNLPMVNGKVEDNKVIIKLDKNFNGNMKLNITNNSASEISVYIKKYSDATGQLGFNNIYGTGKVKRFINNLGESEESNLDEILGDLYEINVSVLKNGEEKFKGQSTNNIIFK